MAQAQKRLKQAKTVATLAVVPLPVDDQGAQTNLLAELGVGAVVLAPAHQFPRGVPLQPQRRSAAITWARTTGGVVIEDDYDAELRYDRAPIGSLQALDPDRVVYVGTASKTLAPGLRLGWMAVPPPLAEPITLLRGLEDMQTPATEQIAFAELLRSGDFERHLRRMRARYRKRRDRFLGTLADRVPTAGTVGIPAGLRVLLELPKPGPASIEIAEHARERSISLFPIARCYHDGRIPERPATVSSSATPPSPNTNSSAASPHSAPSSKRKSALVGSPPKRFRPCRTEPLVSLRRVARSRDASARSRSGVASKVMRNAAPAA